MNYVTGNPDLLGVNSVYLAAPFFNPVQLKLVVEIEHAFEDARVMCFSPRLIHGESPTPIKTPDDARAAFNNNVVALKKCSEVVAVLDYLLPKGSTLRCLSQNETGNAVSYSPALNLPDTGTVFEMGWAYASRRPLYGFTTFPRGEGKLNIMLTQSAKGIIHGVDNLRNWLSSGDASLLAQWEGGMV